MMVHIHFVNVDRVRRCSSLVPWVTRCLLATPPALSPTGFIEMGKIKAIVINEAVHMQTVIYYLCILLKDLADPDAVSCVVPLFQSSKPRLNCLVKVYKSCRKILAKC